MARFRSCLFLSLLVTAFSLPASAVLVRDHTNASSKGDLWDVSAAAYVTDIPVHLKKNVPVVFWTTNLSHGGDPILHLLGPGASTNGAVTELARDDDSGGNLNARLSFTPPQDGDYQLILHATSSKGQGTCDLMQDNMTPLLGNIPFGAAMREYDDLREDETLTMAYVPNGLVNYPALYFFDDTGRIVRRHQPVNAVVSATLEQSYTRLYVLAAKSIPLPTTGPIRVVRNDARLSGHDPDKDGLGSELEGKLGTCSSPTDIALDFDCGLAADLRDTDGDGLSDADELLGKMDVQPPMWLSIWGADPRHKDIFIEVDFSQAYPGETPSKMSPEKAKEMAAVYADTSTTLTPFDALLHARYLNNPDSRPGVNLHLDTGVAPLTPADATIYGDWGGYSVVPPASDGQGHHWRQDADTAYKFFMDPARRGTFHYTNSYLGSGGQCHVGITCSWSQNDLYIAAHELGHTLTLNHYGPTVVNANEANCKVNYPSVMNYAQQPLSMPFAFSDGYGRPPVNNTALHEMSAFDPGQPRTRDLLLRLAAHGYMVELTTGNVDWNRDGVYQSGTVSAYSNSYGGSQCEFSSSNRMPLNQTSFHTPAIARLGDQVFVFYLDAAAGDILSVQVSNPKPFQCAPFSGDGCSGTQFTDFKAPLPWSQGIVSIAAQSLIDAGKPTLLLMFTDSAGRLWQTAVEPGGAGAPTFSPPVRIPTSQPVFEEISMTGASDRDHAWLSYKDSPGHIWLMKRSGGQWGPDAQVQISDLVPPSTSPAIYETPDGTLYGAFPRLAGTTIHTLRLWKRNASGLWDDTGYLSTENSLGKPAMAWRPLPSSTVLPGRLYLYWSRIDSNGSKALMENWLVRDNLGNVKMDFSMFHSNSSFAVYGVAALFEPSFDEEIRLAVPFIDKNPNNAIPDGALEVRPRADGLANINQVDRDDWEAMGIALCQVLTGEQTDPMQCPQ